MINQFSLLIPLYQYISEKIIYIETINYNRISDNLYEMTLMRPLPHILSVFYEANFPDTLLVTLFTCLFIHSLSKYLSTHYMPDIVVYAGHTMINNRQHCLIEHCVLYSK